jgi:hypothetical protein
MNPHLPAEIERAERVHILSRRRKFGIAAHAPALGIALSGGGIRSATVSLGVFQYLAHEEKLARASAAATGHAATATPREEAAATTASAAAPGGEPGALCTVIPSGPARLLSRLDYCSSVSGGGYFATFFTSLFLPKSVRDQGALVTPEIMPAVVPPVPAPAPGPSEWELAAARATDALCDTDFDGSRMTPMRWLRENGRYLAPTGGGDYLLAIAVAIRNFFALHYVIAVSLLTIFLLLAAVRVFGFAYNSDFGFAALETAFLPQPGADLWPSVWWILPLAALALVLVPLGVAFFLAQTERWGPILRVNLPLITALAIAAPCCIFAASGALPSPLEPSAWLSALAAADWSFAAIARWDVGRLAAGYIGVAALLAAIFYLATRLIARAPLPADGELAPGARAGEPAATTITRTLLSQWMIVPLVVTLTLAAFALVDTIGQTVYALWTVDAHQKWLAGGGTIAVLIPLLKQLLPLVTGSGDPTTKAWVRVPLSGLALVAGVALFVAVASVWSVLTHALIFAGDRPPGDPGCRMVMAGGKPVRGVTLDTAQRIVVNTPSREVTCGPGATPLRPEAWGWLFVPFLLIGLLTGHVMGFINLSSLQRYYAGHLMRSYLRASRFAEDPDAERDVQSAARTDDITVNTYYHPGALAPLHYINVTLNQTVASGSQLVQRDRKGMNVAIGPYGFTVGNRSFVRWTVDGMDYRLQRCPAKVIGRPDDSALPRYVQDTKLVVEPLSIGNWCAISGAAFTTGHGKGTTLGLSLLLALTNVRLGYWWNAEVEAPKPSRVARNASRFVEFVCAVFGTQSYLLNELFGRYYGTRRSHWYLSDGGHFENTAGYELIRRRVPSIIVLDNGHDADYTFEDIANLVRKARIDLDTEIEFLTALELSQFIDASVRPYFGTPEEFQSGHAAPVYATLARVRYRDAPEGLLLVLKPRVGGIEPLDILNYKAASPDFPQQSTTNQFYDEAQWESYRSLGYWIAQEIFCERTQVTQGKWLPRHMFSP